jgi:glycerophosphoryl diester phosphodiesterase
MRHPFFDVAGPIVLGHRGAAGEAPENTLPSFERALAVGANVLESDVHPTCDGVPVLIHDDTLERTTDGAGRVSELTWKELSALDAGFRFSPDGGRSFPFRGRGLRVPSLEQVLEAFPGARLNLEIKEAPVGAVRRVIESIARAGRAERTLLAAEKDPIMAEIRAELAATGVRTAVGASVGDVLGFVRAALDGRPPPPEPMALQIPEAFGGRPLVTPALLRHAHAHDVQVHVWTVNEPERIEALLDLGVDGLISDFPGRVAAAAARRRAGR